MIKIKNKQNINKNVELARTFSSFKNQLTQGNCINLRPVLH